MIVGCGDGGDVVFESCDVLFEDVCCWIYDVGVDVVEFLEVEEVCIVIGVVEGEGGCLVDWYCVGVCFGSGFLIGVDL